MSLKNLLIKNSFTYKIYIYYNLYIRHKAHKIRRQYSQWGEDLVIEVPCGTVIYDNLINEEIIDLKGNLDEIEIVSGGKGGNGNAKYKSSKNRSPK